MEKYIVNPIIVRMNESEKGIIYKSIVAMGFRARQINDSIKNEIQTRMADINKKRKALRVFSLSMLAKKAQNKRE